MRRIPESFDYRHGAIRLLTLVGDVRDDKQKDSAGARKAFEALCPGEGATEQVKILILPGLDTDSAYRLADRLTDGLGDASGACSRFTFEVRVFNHPENAATARYLS